LNFGDKRSAYLKTWKQLFYELKGWDEKATLKWAEKWEDALIGHLSPLYHWGAVKTAVPSLIDQSIKKSVGKNLQHLSNDIQDVIERAENNASPRVEHPDTVENYDWEYVRGRIVQLIKEYQKKRQLI